MAVKKDPQLTEHLEGRGPGAHLRNAREQAGMSVGAVADALLLKTKTLELLEADAHDRLPAPTFVRGYLRGYARVLGLPSGPILDMYDRQGFEPPALTNEVTDPPQAHTSDTPVRLVTYAVAVALALLVGLWWHSQEDGGFGISGDLFDWLPDADQDPSLLTAEESGTSPEEADADEASVAMASDPTDELPRDDDSPGRPHVGEVETASAGTGPEGAPVAMPSLEPGAAPGDVESLLAPPAGGASSGEGAAAEAVPAGTGAEDAPVAAPSLRTDTVPQGGESAGTSQTVQATTGGIPPVEAAPGGASAPGAVAGEASATQGAQPGAVAGEASAAQEAQPETVAGIDRAADPGAGGGNVPIPDSSVATDSADETAGASLADASATETERAAPDTRAGSTAAAGTARSGLVLEFAHESWVEVYDRERARLHFNLVQPGSVLSFDGPQPFDVLLGYGKDARVTIDGQAFDHTPFLKHGVARFSVGSESAGGTNVAESGR